jgi:hypothetical protein
MLPRFAAAVCEYLFKSGKTPGLMILSDYTLNNESPTSPAGTSTSL